MSKRQRRAQRERRHQAAVAAKRVGTTGGLAVVATLVSGAVAEAATIQVANTHATGAGSLAAAITQSNNDATGSDTIVFESGVSGSIDLTGALPTIKFPVTITGPGANVLTVQGTGASGDFYIASGLSGTTTISGLSVTGGVDTSDGGGISAASPLKLKGDDIYGNTGGFGGGVLATDGVTLYGSTVSGNTATISGGGVAVTGGSFAMKYSTIANNTAKAGAGGGLLSTSGGVDLFDSTISGNSAPSTVANTGTTKYGEGGGLYLESGTTGWELYNTIVFGNTAGNAGSDIYAAKAPAPSNVKFSSIGTLAHSGITSPDATNQISVNPLLGPLQNNGGTTLTMAPAFNSPVIDKGDQAASPLNETIDQRGLPRPVDLPGYPNATGGDGSDIGAVELQASEVVPVVTGLSASSGTAGSTIVISGSRLSTATSVLFGSNVAAFTVNSGGQLVATVPAGSGTLDVRVVTPGGESAAVAADQFTYKPPPPPPPTTQTTTATFGNQHVTLTSPALSACVASTSALKATLTSATVSGGTTLKFSSAGFFIDKGVKHTTHKTKHLKNGGTKKITVTTFVANAVVHGVPATVSISLTGVAKGTHTLKVVISYKEKVTKHHKKKTETVTKTISSTFTVC